MPRAAVSTQNFTTGLSAGNLATVDSANWDEKDGYAGYVEVVTAAPAGLTNSFSNQSTCRHKGTYAADQYAEVTLGGTVAGNTDKSGVVLRASADATPNDDGYRVYFFDGVGVVVKRTVNGTEANLTTGTTPVTGPTWASGDKLSAEVEGTGATVTLRVYRTPSGGSLTLLATFTDTDGARILSGKPSVLKASSAGTSRITAWEAGDLVAGSGPTINTQPTNQTVAEGATAAFTVSATASGGSLTYQWRKNGVNVVGGSGGTSASYTTPATTVADNAAVFTCVVTDSNGSTTTSNAVLTVTGATPYFRERLIDKSGAALASQTGLTALIWHTAPSGAPVQTLASLTTDGSGNANWALSRGALALGAPIWILIVKDGTPAKAGARKVTPVYE